MVNLPDSMSSIVLKFVTDSKGSGGRFAAVSNCRNRWSSDNLQMQRYVVGVLLSGLNKNVAPD